MFGSIKKYKEVPCKACEGNGRSKIVLAKVGGFEGSGDTIDQYLKLCQGICLGCNGKGTQTVLERSE